MQQHLKRSHVSSLNPFLFLPLPSPEKFIHYQRYVHFIWSRLFRTLKDTSKIERHHIVPKSFGMNVDFKTQKWNIINLTPREHYIAHMMLWKTYGGKMTYAFHQLCNSREFNIKNSRIYEAVKLDYRKEMSTLMKVVKKEHPQKCSEATREKMRKSARKGLPKHTENVKRKLSKEREGINNPLWVGYFVSPHGTFTTIKTAAKYLKCSSDSLYQRKELVPEKYYSIKQLPENCTLNKVIKPFKRYHGAKGKYLTREWILQNNC